MLDDLQLQGRSERTQETYLRSVRLLEEYCRKSADQIDQEQIRKYFLYLHQEKHWSRTAITIALCGLKYCYEKTLHQDWSVFGVVRPNLEKKLPVVLSREEVRRILELVRLFTYRACLTTIYSCAVQSEGLLSHSDDGCLPGNSETCQHPQMDWGLVGSVAVLQTWTHLRYHPHVHVIVTGGGLSKDGKHWMPTKNDFLLPAPVLAKVFRGKFRHQLSRYPLYKNVPSSVWSKDWVVDIREVGTGQTAFRYLAPYVFRVAISNKRIVSFKDGNVTFLYKDSKAKDQKLRSVTLTAENFIHRFLQHVLPLRFQKVRHYGLFSPRNKRLLQTVFDLLHCAPPPKLKSEPQQTSTKSLLCPNCAVPMIPIEILPRSKSLPLAVRSP